MRSMTATGTALTRTASTAALRRGRRAAKEYVGVLQACALLEQPMGAAAFTLLTTLLRPHEMMRSSTVVVDGMLHVVQGPAHHGPVSARVVPLPEFSASVLAGDEGPLPGLLCLPGPQPGLFLAELSNALEAARDVAGDPVVARHLQLHQLLPLALNALLAAAWGPDQRIAVMAYAGVAPLGVRAARDRTELDERDLRFVARLVDELVTGAGYAVIIPVGAASA